MQWSCICLLFQIKVIGSQMHLALTSFCSLRRGVDKWRASHRLSQTETESVPGVPPLRFRHPQGQRLLIQLLIDTCVTLMTAVVSFRLLRFDLFYYSESSVSLPKSSTAVKMCCMHFSIFTENIVNYFSIVSGTVVRRKCFCVWAVCCSGT